jgi:hypothetical protein
MTGIEIKEKIAANNKRITELVDPHRFVLNEEISRLLEENRQLRAQCSHKFEDGKCIYCAQEE